MPWNFSLTFIASGLALSRISTNSQFLLPLINSALLKQHETVNVLLGFDSMGDGKGIEKCWLLFSNFHVFTFHVFTLFTMPCAPEFAFCWKLQPAARALCALVDQASHLWKNSINLIKSTSLRFAKSESLILQKISIA